jgi:hypothetical protein
MPGPYNESFLVFKNGEPIGIEGREFSRPFILEAEDHFLFGLALFFAAHSLALQSFLAGGRLFESIAFAHFAEQAFLLGLALGHAERLLHIIIAH